MSSKYLQAFTQENKDFQKQIGCMTGIFHMFDRHHLLTGRRLSGHKRIPTGHSPIKTGSIEVEQKGLPPQITLDKNLSKGSHENQRTSMESSRTSFSSSSCSSSFSSLECNKSAHQEPPSSYRTIAPERSSVGTAICKGSNTENKHTKPEPCSELSNESAQTVQKSIDIRDMVKDSINKDAHSLSVKTPIKTELKTRTLKHIDSPRPMPLSKHMDGSCRDGTTTQQKVPVDLNESLKVHVNLKEAPWYFSESTELPRSSYAAKDVSFYQASNGTPRFSYDGREASRASLDSRESSKPVSKLKELPRLSLDSRSSTFESIYNPMAITKVLDNTSIKQRVAPVVKHQQEVSHNRLPGVVAKLMGLENLPNFTKDFEESTEMKAFNRERTVDVNNRQEHSIFLPHSSNMDQTSKEDLQQSCSPKNSPRVPATMKHKNQDRLMKPISASRIPVETAPWKQHDKVHSNSRAGFRYWEGNLKQENESVYSQIEKRLKELEFNQSNKDLRALKQILDTMQAKGLLETKKAEEKHLKASTQKRSPRRVSIEAEGSSSSEQDPSSLKQGSSVGKFQSPIVIMKSAKSIKKLNASISSDIPLEGISHLPKLKINYSLDGRKTFFHDKMEKEQTPRLNNRDSTNKKFKSRTEESSNSRNSGAKPLLNSVQIQHTHSSPGMVKSVSSVSPRLQLKKLDAEKKTCPPLSSGSNKIHGQSANRQTSDSISSRNKLPRRLIQVHQSKEQVDEATRLGHQDDEISLRSDSGTSLASHADTEVTSIYHSVEWNNTVSQLGMRSPSGRAASKTASTVKQMESSRSVNRNDSTIEPTTIVLEQPSPISVLDASFFHDDLPVSLVKKLSDEFNDKDCQPPEDNSSHKQIDEKSASTSEINHKKLEKIENLVQKLKELNPVNDEAEATDHIASLCENNNPDHRYISEILLASGLLMKDLSSGPTGSMPIQLHHSGYPINPDLFLVLEQTKCGWQHKLETLGESKPKSDTQKIHRKLLFDSVNVILVKKLELKISFPCPDSFRVKKPAGKFPSGQQLLRELCLEIDQLQADCLNSESFSESRCRTGEEVMQHSEWLEDLRKEVPGLVLEIERLIFKDMIVEILSDEVVSRVHVKPCRQRKNL